ncbi:MAG: hypothetical protein EXS09_20425 [Gemmataceae bacterium]|nr:hypothetical protein [Gemmataceae bacterium]
MNTHRIWLATLILLWIVLIIACSGPDAPTVAEKKVKEAPPGQVVRLGAAELNRLFHLNDGEKPIPYGSICEITGTVTSVTVREETKPTEKTAQVFELYEIQLIIPDYAAVVISCQFTSTMKSEISRYKPGHKVTLRGRLEKVTRIFGSTPFLLNGCIFP